MAEFHHETARLVLPYWREEDWPRFWAATSTTSAIRWLGMHRRADLYYPDLRHDPPWRDTFIHSIARDDWGAQGNGAHG